MKTQYSIFQQKRKKNNDAGSNKRGWPPEDSSSVMCAAALLQISEFQLFHLAYEQWYGRKTSDSLMENVFISYMFDGIIPHWVRQLTRKVLSLYEHNKLNPQEFNIKRPDVTPEMRARGQWYIIMLLIIVVIFCVLISGYVPPQ